MSGWSIVTGIQGSSGRRDRGSGGRSQAVANGLEEMDKLGAQACEDLRRTGAQLSAMPADDVAAWKERAGIAEGWVNRYTERGYDAQSVLDDYRRIIREETPQSQYVDQFYACLEGATR